MLYSILKTIIDTTIVQYTCQTCQWKINENSIHVGEIRDLQIHLDITCPHCQSHAHIHAEVANIDTQIPGGIPRWEQENSLIKKNENALNESDIQEVSKNLENIQSIEDLLK
jgi:DNA-directed RNA polymerase subunit RPC12/RpoP